MKWQLLKGCSKDVSDLDNQDQMMVIITFLLILYSALFFYSECCVGTSGYEWVRVGGYEWARVGASGYECAAARPDL